MTTPPAWLPELVLFESCGGDWTTYEEVLYAHFKADFIVSMPACSIRTLKLKRHPMEKNREATFWHCIQEGKVEAERTPDFRRCERIRWIKPMIEAINTARVVCWRNVRQTKRGREENIVIALSDFSYVVILRDRTTYALVWTAYTIHYENNQRKLKKEYEEWKKTGAAL